MMSKSAKRFSDNIMVRVVDFAAYMRRQVFSLTCMLKSSERPDERALLQLAFHSRICATSGDFV
jgi:hypothetical protein